MSARPRKKVPSSQQDATRWRRFLTNAPTLTELAEIRRLHDNKTMMRRRGELPPTFSAKAAERRPFF